MPLVAIRVLRRVPLRECLERRVAFVELFVEQRNLYNPARRATTVNPTIALRQQ